MDLKGPLSAALAGRYEIEREIGRGGMAVVYLAHDLRHDRRIAIKVLRPEFAASLVADRFLREIRIAAQLQHPLIVPLHDSGADHGLLWYVMPFVEGETLRARLNRESQLPADEALRITSEVAEALAHAHEHGVIHRDIKPENILLSGGHALVADFGIARAVTEAGGQSITSTGLAIGTPAYMSPEQGTGDARLDARSDLYSLGCVLYEVLAGEPPFTGPTPQSVIAKHVSQTPPSVRVVRPALLIGLESLITRALAKAPADRYRSAREFQLALHAAAEGAPATALPGSRRLWLALGFAGAAAAIALFVLVPRVFVGGELSPSRYVLAHLLSAAGNPGATHFREWEHELMGALRQVPDITVLESTLVNDQRVRRAGNPANLDYWIEVARALGAGKLVIPSVIERENATDVVAEVYDVGRGRTVGRASVDLGEAAPDPIGGAARLAERLFGLPVGVLRVSGSRVGAARRAFVAGIAALETWNLRLATDRFESAAAADPAYAEAHLWIAQARAWAGDPEERWVGAARRAVAGVEQLANEQQRIRARALLALAESRFPQACVRYDSLLARDSLDFAAWFGLGECQARDDVVVPDPDSPSGWHWRSSYHAAAGAYERALQVVPSFVFAFPPSERLSRILVVEPYRRRPGRPLPPDTGVYYGYAALERDTLAFVPWPAAVAAVGKLPSTLNAAVDKNRQRLRDVVGAWARAFPDSSRPHLELARALELSGALDGIGNGQRSALAATRRARATARVAADSLTAAVLEVRLLVKLSQFSEARELATQLLGRWRNPELEQADQLASLAALTGRVHLTARLSRLGAARLRSMPDYSEVPLPILELTEGGLAAYAALGAPAESIAAFAARLDTVLLVHVTPAQAARFRCWQLRMPVGYAFPQLGRAIDPQRCREGIPMLEMQWALAQGDTAAVRRYYEQGRALRRDILPGDLAINHYYHEAWVLAQAGDSLEAGRYLGRALGALRALRSSVIRTEPEQSAGLVRVMALRADLAARAGDQATARQWAEPVTVLWRDADPELRPVVEQMRILAGAAQRRR